MATDRAGPGSGSAEKRRGCRQNLKVESAQVTDGLDRRSGRGQ